MKFKIPKSGWVVKKERPEEIYGKPEKYYTSDEIFDYSNSTSIKQTQEKIALKIVEFLGMRKGKILDLGCGPGFTAEVYLKKGFDVLGLDVLEEMLDFARKKNINCVRGDILNLKEMFGKGEFDGVVSASALQWIKEKEEIEKVAVGINYILKDEAKCVIQFYPKSEIEFENFKKIFKKNGFDCSSFIQNPENPKKRVIYLIFKKRKAD